MFPSTKLQDLQENKTNWFPEWPDIRCFIPRPSLQTVTIEWIKTVRTMSVLFKLYNNRTLIPCWSVLCSSTKVKTAWQFYPHLLSHHFPPCLDHVLMYPERSTLVDPELTSNSRCVKEILLGFVWGFWRFYLFILFYLPHNNYKKYRKEEKKKWRGDLTETIGAHERLGLLELWARAVSH